MKGKGCNIKGQKRMGCEKLRHTTRLVLFAAGAIGGGNSTQMDILWLKYEIKIGVCVLSNFYVLPVSGLFACMMCLPLICLPACKLLTLNLHLFT
jgi:hypothetical protein